ncbi:hypothetical protein ACE6H2_028532 [Prunus campanulata]
MAIHGSLLGSLGVLSVLRCGNKRTKEWSYNFKFDCNLICIIVYFLVGCNFKFNIGLFYYFCQRIVVVSIWELGQL